MRAAGLSSKPFPGEKFLFGLFNTFGETLPSMALARQAVSLAKGRSQAIVSAAAEQAAQRLVDDGGPVRRCSVCVASCRRSAGGTRHDDAVRPGAAVRRPPGARRRGRHALSGQPGRYLRRYARRTVRVVGREARGDHEVGTAARHRSRGELRILRQRVRHADARCGRTSRRRQPGSTDGADGSRASLADRQPRRVARRARRSRWSAWRSSGSRFNSHDPLRTRMRASTSTASTTSLPTVR